MSKKLLALTLSLMLVVSSFASTLSVFAAGTTATELKQELKNIAAADFTTEYNLASSLISGKAGSLYYFNVAEGDQLNSIPMYVANSGTANPNALTANSIRADKFHNIGAKTWESGQYVNMKQSNDESQRFYQLNYDIGDVAAIDEIVVAAPFRDSHLVLAPGHYKISVAYNEADLFTAKALTGEFTNANAQTGNNVMIFSATSGDIYGQWIGIRLISTYQPEWEGNANTNNSWGRLEHIGVYGAVCPHEATAPSYDADNHFNACTVCGKQFDVVAHTLDLTNNGENHSEACDCGYASSSAPHAFDKYVDDGDKHYTECICGAKTEAVDHEYGALDKFTKEEKCVCGDVKANDNPFTITNTKGGKAEYEAAVALADSIILGKNVTATYICEATGVTTPTKLPLYRTKSDNSSCNDTETFNHLTTATVLDDGRFYHAGSKAWGSGAFLKLSDGKNLTDDETKAYAQFVYNIGSAAEIDKVSFYSYSNVLNSIGHYKVSFANDAADLFTDAAVYTTPDLYSDGSFSIVDINEGEEFYAKYVGFRLISLNENTSVKGWADGSYFRLNNFAVFGEICECLEEDIVPSYDSESHFKMCSNCGTRYEVIPHDKDIVDNGDGTHGEACDCGYAASVPHDKEIVVGAKEENCTEPGYTGDKYCSVCNALSEQGAEIPVDPNKHVAAESANKVDATCRAPGFSGDVYCKYHPEFLMEAGQVVPDDLDNHTFTEKGHNDFCHWMQCKDCGFIDATTIGICKAGAAHLVTPATQEADGVEEYYCVDEICGRLMETKPIAKIEKVALSTTSYSYDGKTKKPTVTVTDANGKKLTSGVDYTYVRDSAKKVGTYKVTVTFKGNYAGEAVAEFKINPAKTSIKSLTAGSKKFTVKWSKKTSYTKGYIIEYSTSKKFTSAKSKKITKNSTTSATISKLSAKKKYYVRVRCYYVDDDVTYYSSWSSVKYVTTKK